MTLGETGIINLALRNKKFRFLLVGGINTLWGVVSFPVFYVLLERFGFHYIVILTLAYFFNTVFAYTMQKLFVFRTEGNAFKEFLKFGSLQIAFYLTNVLVLPVFVELFKVQPMIAQTAFALTLAVISFIFHDKVTFKQKSS